jgi:hypothetical protein
MWHPFVIHLTSTSKIFVRVEDMKPTTSLIHENLRLGRRYWREMLGKVEIAALANMTRTFGFSITAGDLMFLNGKWYVTHTGLIGLARRAQCIGIQVVAMRAFCDPIARRWAFKATVFSTRSSKGFVGYGDADPSNVSPLVHGAEMRVAETRAVNRALRKAYGIGICSAEEIGSITPHANPSEAETRVRKLPPESANGNGKNGHGSNGNTNGIRVRDHLCQVIRQYGLDAELVKAYAIDFCGTKTLREASREQVESFVAHLADWAAKDRNAVLCQLNSYSRPQAGAA